MTPQREPLVRRGRRFVWLKLARAFDWPRMSVLYRTGNGLDWLDRKLGDAAWWCRHRGIRHQGGNDDGIPF